MPSKARPLWVSRIAPNPARRTARSPRLQLPAALAEITSASFHCAVVVRDSQPTDAERFRNRAILSRNRTTLFAGGHRGIPDLACRQLPAARLADRPRASWPGASRRGSARQSCGGSIRSTWSRRSATRRCWRSALRRTPGSTSSPTARSAGRATRTRSPRRWTGSTSTTPARRSTAAATRIRSRASAGRSAGGTRSTSTRSGSCGRTPTGPSRSPSPARSPWRSRRRTTTTRARKRPRSPTPTP